MVVVYVIVIFKILVEISVLICIYFDSMYNIYMEKLGYG